MGVERESLSLEVLKGSVNSLGALGALGACPSVSPPMCSRFLFQGLFDSLGRCVQRRLCKRSFSPSPPVSENIYL